jgi:spermidine synthase
MLRDRRSIVAVDPTARGIAYIFFERGELLDWGHRRCGRNECDVISFVEGLVARCAADLVILEDAAAFGSKRCLRIRELLRALGKTLRQRGVAVVEVARVDVRERWIAKGLTTKEAVAAAIGNAIPELLPFVPPVRKTWMSEHPHVNVFDAASLALNAFGYESHIAP